MAIGGRKRPNSGCLPPESPRWGYRSVAHFKQLPILSEPPGFVSRGVLNLYVKHPLSLVRVLRVLIGTQTSALLLPRGAKHFRDWFGVFPGRLFLESAIGGVGFVILAKNASSWRVGRWQ